MVSHMQDHVAPAKDAALSDEQFDKLVALLQPGYELSSLMLADYKMRAAESAKTAAAE
jgi:hypothetical protein